MTDENLESNQSAGSAGTTNSDASQNTGVQPTSTFSAEELLKQLEPLIERKVQSVKDRRFAEQEQFRSEFQPVLERFKDLVSPEQLKEIQKDLEFEDLKRRVYGEKQTGEPPQAGNLQVPAINPAQVVLDYGLDPKDPALALIVNGKFQSVEQAELAVARHIKASRTAPSPTAAQEPAATGGAPHAMDAAGLKTNYIKEMTAARGNKSLMKGLQNKYRELGVDVGGIDFRV